MRPYISLLTLLVFGTCQATVQVTPCFADEKADRFLFLIDGEKFEREKLITGIVRGKGERILTREIDGKTISDTAPVEYFIAFDFLEGNTRVDRHEVMFKENGGYERHLGQYIEKKDSIEYCSYMPDDNSMGSIFVAQPKEGPDYEFRSKWYCHPLDIRSIGHLELWRFVNADSPPFTDRMDSYKKRIPEVVVEEENGIIRYEYHGRTSDGILNKGAVWIDTKNGFTTRRILSVWELGLQRDQHFISRDTHVSWKKQSGVWVPVDIIFEENVPPTANEKEKFVMTFDWESVNNLVDDEYFSYCSFVVNEESPVDRVGTKAQAIEGHSGGRLGIVIDLCGTKEGRLMMKQMGAKESSRRFWQWTFMIVGIVLIVVGISLKLLMRIQNRSN